MLSGWPKLARARGSIDGYPLRRRAIGMLAGWPDTSRRLAPAHALAQGLVGWWPLDEGQGLVARDLSIYGNAGTLTNMANPGTSASGWGAGLSQRELAFDGSNDCIVIPHAAQLAITSSITISIWANTTTVAGYRQLLCKGPNPTSYPAPYQMVQVGGTGQMIWGRGNGSAPGTTDAVVSVATPGANKAAHWCGTWAAGVFKIYLNGVLDNSATASPTCTDAGLPLYIATRADGAAALWSGLISHLRIYNRALSATEIPQLYTDKWAGAA